MYNCILEALEINQLVMPVAKTLHEVTRLITEDLLTRRDLFLEKYISSNKLNHYNYLDSPKGLALQTLNSCSTYKYKLAPSGALMYTSMNILI
jgi:hypothetical protein